MPRGRSPHSRTHLCWATLPLGRRRAMQGCCAGFAYLESGITRGLGGRGQPPSCVRPVRFGATVCRSSWFKKTSRPLLGERLAIPDETCSSAERADTFLRPSLDLPWPLAVAAVIPSAG